MTIFQRWKQTALHNKALVLTGVIVALGTLVSTGALVVQVCITAANNRKTSEQIGKLIAAADDMSEASDNFSDSSFWMEQHTDDAANAIQDSVDTADRTPSKPSTTPKPHFGMSSGHGLALAALVTLRASRKLNRENLRSFSSIAEGLQLLIAGYL